MLISESLRRPESSGIVIIAGIVTNTVKNVLLPGGALVSVGVDGADVFADAALEDLRLVRL